MQKASIIGVQLGSKDASASFYPFYFSFLHRNGALIRQLLNCRYSHTLIKVKTLPAERKISCSILTQWFYNISDFEGTNVNGQYQSKDFVENFMIESFGENI